MFIEIWSECAVYNGHWHWHWHSIPLGDSFLSVWSEEGGKKGLGGISLGEISLVCFPLSYEMVCSSIFFDISKVLFIQFQLDDTSEFCVWIFWCLITCKDIICGMITIPCILRSNKVQYNVKWAALLACTLVYRVHFPNVPSASKLS